jgi:hypothetical protein
LSGVTGPPKQVGAPAQHWYLRTAWQKFDSDFYTQRAQGFGSMGFGLATVPHAIELDKSAVTHITPDQVLDGTWWVGTGSKWDPAPLAKWVTNVPAFIGTVVSRVSS